MRVVIVEDNRDLSRLIADYLDGQNINSECVPSGADALDVIEPGFHDLIVLDRGLPDMDGLMLLEILRGEGIKIPVLVLTALDGLGDKVRGLNSGADDYMVKPFEMEELVARIRALCRRPQDVADVRMQIGNLELLPAESAAQVGGRRIELSAREREALERLMRLPGRVVGKDDLQTALYGGGEEGSRNSVEIVIHRLRRKLERAHATLEIHTLRGIGYLARVREAER